MNFKSQRDLLLVVCLVFLVLGSVGVVRGDFAALITGTISWPGTDCCRPAQNPVTAAQCTGDDPREPYCGCEITCTAANGQIDTEFWSYALVDCNETASMQNGKWCVGKKKYKPIGGLE